MEITENWDAAIQDHLNAGTFTPFLGAGAASLRSYDSIALDDYPWEQVGQNLRDISRSLSDESRSFLRNFVRQRLRLSEKDATRLVPIADDIPRKSDPGTNLVDLQIALVNAMRQLTQIFGDSFIEQVPSLRELPDCAVKLSFKTDAVKAAWLELFKAIVIAKELKVAKARNKGFLDADSPHLPKDLPDDSTRRFKVASVYRQLVVLARQLIPREKEDDLKSELFEAEFEQVPDLNTLGNELIRTSSVRGQLRLDTMQWLGDLLEYSLGYWIPRFPTTAELAFEMGLAVPSGGPRRAELAQAAQALSLGKKGGAATRYVKELMDYCEKALATKTFAPAHRRFYLAIAVALCDQWDSYDAARSAAGPPRSNGTDRFRTANSGGDTQVRAGHTAVAVDAEPVRKAFLPVAATTNYDCGLELVLSAFDIQHHIVFPIQPGETEDTMLQWVCRRITPGKYPDDTRFTSNVRHLPETVRLSGPVIVKLHGAPTLPEAKDQRGDDINHKIVISEQEYLEALQGDAATLQWFEREMFAKLADDPRRNSDESSRAIWFLGYSIADWNVRLRLYSHLRTAGQSRGKTMRAVNRDYDPFRQAILDQLRINLCHGDLNLVPTAIYEYYNDPVRRPACSANVQKLMNALDDYFN